MTLLNFIFSILFYINQKETAVQYRCSRTEYDYEDYYRNFAIRKEEMRNYLERYQCVDYEYGSIKCHFFWWVIAIIVIVGFVIILIVAAICYRFIRKKRSGRIETTDVKVHK
jgi:ABC-type antimicrobial peptide transport system permease subunit